MRQYILPVTTTGSAGAATGTASEAVEAGQLMGLLVRYNSAPATTDVTVHEVVNGVSRLLLTLTNQNSDLDWYPLVQGQNAVNVDIASWYISPVLFGGLLRVSVAEANAAAPAVTVIAVVQE